MISLHIFIVCVCVCVCVHVHAAAESVKCSGTLRKGISVDLDSCDWSKITGCDLAHFVFGLYIDGFDCLRHCLVLVCTFESSMRKCQTV